MACTTTTAARHNSASDEAGSQYVNHNVQIGNIFPLQRMVENQLGIAILPRVSITPPLEGMVVRDFDDFQFAPPVWSVRCLDLNPPSAALHLLLDELHKLREVATAQV